MTLATSDPSAAARGRHLAARAALCSIAFALGFLPPSFLVAQEAAPAPSPADDAIAASALGNALTTIVVTARKRSENLQDVPLAVSSFDADTLAGAVVTDAMQLQTVVPSLVYNTTGDAAQPYLRGVGTRLATVGLEPSIATYVDDRYVPRPIAAIFEMLDVERVEVLKGPQGTLYGRNSAGGAIRVITRDPGRDPAFDLAVSAGRYDEVNVGLVAGGALSAALRGQIAVGAERRDGLATNLVSSGRAAADDIDRQLFRGKLLWDVTDSVAAKLSVSQWRHADWAGQDLVAAGVPQANRGGALFGGVTSRDRERFATALDGDNDLRETAADLRLDVDVGRFALVSSTTYTDSSYDLSFDADASSAVLLDDAIREASKTWSQEFQLLSKGSDKLEWIAGAFYYRQRANNAFVFVDSVALQPQFPPGTDATNGLQEVDSEAYALFAQGEYAFDERWSLTLGARLSYESKDATLAAIPGAVTNAPTPFANKKDWRDLTPRVSIERRGRLGLAYVSYARGFKSGGYNYPASLNPVLDPEQLDSYEVGLKSRPDGRLRFNSALFWYDFKDLQVTRGGSGAFLTTENAADARVRGLELDFELLLHADLAVTGGLALIDSEYRDYTAAALIPLRAPPFGSVPLPGGFDARGTSLLRSPDEAAYVGVRYVRRLGGGARMPLTANCSYKGSYYFDFSATPDTEWLKQSAYSVLNARIAYVEPHDKWEIGLWGTNLTDEDYYEDAVLISAASRASYADPRMYGVDFKLRL